MEKKIISIIKNIEEITDWTLTINNPEKNEIYLIDTDIESVRCIKMLTYRATIYVTGKLNGEKAAGTGTCTLLSSMTEVEIKKQLDETVYSASLALNPYYSLPEKEEAIEQLLLCDKTISENMEKSSDVIKDLVINAVKGEKGVRLASTECFLTWSRNRLLTSRGIDYKWESTMIMLEMVLLSGPAGEETESLIIKNERFLELLDIKKTVSRYAQYARDNLNAELPESGKYDVIFTEETLDPFFNYFKMQVSGSGIYNKISNLKIGDEAVKNVEGEKLTLSYDPHLAMGLKSSEYDSFGTLLKKFTFIKDGIFTAVQADKQYADYLNCEVTGHAANLIVKGGENSFKQLLSEGTLVVSRFSDFRPNPITGGFSGEIRNAAVFTNGKMVPVKGGSVTGMMTKAMKKCYLSSEITRRGEYMGPLYIKVLQLDVSGK